MESHYHIQNDDTEVNDFFIANMQENVIKGKIMGEDVTWKGCCFSVM